MTRPRGIRAVASIGLLVVVAALGSFLVWSASVHRGGPLSEGGSWIGTGVPIVAGDVVAASNYQIINDGDETAVLESVRPLGLPAGLELVATYALGKQRPTVSGGGSHYWPDEEMYPRKLLKPVKGFHATPERPSDYVYGTNIVFLVRTKRPGNHRFDFVELRYRVGKKRYRQILTNTWVGCARPRGTSQRPCAPELASPSDQELEEWYDRTSGAETSSE